MERVQDTDQTMEVFENDIDLYLKLFCEEQNIENLKVESQSVWNAALMYVKRHALADPSILKMSKPLEGYNNNNYNNQYSNLNNCNCNAYNIELVNNVCDYYIYICNLYNKGVTISGFSKLTGIGESTIHEWGEDNKKLSKSSLEVYKKLSREYENSAESKLWGNKNPVAVMAILNKRFGWNLPGVSKERTSERTLTAAELPTVEEIKRIASEKD